MAIFEGTLPRVPFGSRCLRLRYPAVTGTDVKLLQAILARARTWPEIAARRQIPRVGTNGSYRRETSRAVAGLRAFFGYRPRGAVQAQTFALLGQPMGDPVMGRYVLGERRLEMGVRGEDVLALQCRLLYLGASFARTLGLPPSGCYDERTAAAVRTFQALIQLYDPELAVTGVCALETANALLLTTDYGGRYLALGDAGLDVLILQRELRSLGFAPGEMDGFFGPGTAEAVGDFQAQAGIHVTERVGPLTFMALAERKHGLPLNPLF